MRRFLLLFAGLLCAGTAAAQSALDVTLLHLYTREPVPGLVVQLNNDAIGLKLEGRTDGNGRVRFDGLSTAGAYTVVVPEAQGFYRQTATDLVLRANATRTVNLVLVPFSNVELENIEVTASGGFAELNRTNAEVSATLSPREVQALPVEGRDLTRALFRLPGVTQATGFYPEAPNVSVNGANSLFVNYLIDGLDNNEQFLGGQRFAVPIGFVQDVTVLTNNFSTEFGRTGNGVFNVTTRSGGNEVTGEAFYLTRPGSVFDGSSSFAQRDLLGNPVKDGFARYQLGFGVGGPIQKDKTFYYVNVEQTYDVKDNLLSVPQLGLNETVRGTNRFTYASARVDQRWSKAWRSALRLNVGVVDNDRQGGGLEGGVQFPSAASTQARTSTNIAFTNTFNRGNLLFESNYLYGYFDWNYAQPEISDRAQTVVLGPTEQTVAVLGHPGYDFHSLQHTFQTQQKATLRAGTHRVKVGLDVLYTDHALFGGGNPNGNYTVKLTQPQLDALKLKGSSLNVDDIPASATVLNYSVELQPGSYGVGQGLYAVYVEDAIEATADLTLTLGLRYDYDTISKGGSTGNGDLDNLAPRVSFNYALDARSVVRGGYGMFYDKIVYSVYSDALQQNSTSAGYRGQLQQLIDLGILPGDTDLDAITFDGNVSADFSNVPYLGGPTPDEVQASRAGIFSNERRILNPDGYDNPLTHQFSLGYQRQLDARTLFYVDGVHTRAYDLLRLRNLNAPAAYPIDPENVVVRTPAAADATRPVAPVTGGARNIVVTESGGRAEYYAAIFNLVRERSADDPFAFRASYTLSRLMNDTEDINFRAMDANDFEAEWGPSINDRTHVLNGILYYAPARALTLSIAALLQSGQPINRIPDATLYGTTDLNGDGRSFGDAYVGNSDRQPGEKRNSDRLPWSSTFDVGVQYNLPFAGQMLEFRADVFNVFDAQNLSGYSNNATQSNQVQVGPRDSGLLVRRNASAPRQVQLGLRVVF